MNGDRMRRADVSWTHFYIVSVLERHGDLPMSRLAEVLRSEIIEQVLGRLDPAQLAGVASALVDLRGALAATLIDDRSGLNHSHQAQGRD